MPDQQDKTTSARPRNEVWDALAAAVGWAPEPGDKAAAKRFGKCVRDLKAAGATAASIRERAARYKATWPGIRITPEGLVKHWSAMQPPQAQRDRPAGAPEPDEDPNELYERLRRG